MLTYLRSDTIQTVNYDGLDFHYTFRVSTSLLQHPFAISVFGNWVYWSDWRTNSINRVCNNTPTSGDSSS